MQTFECDFLIIGGGIAGASLAYELAPQGRVIILEKESQPGYHATGRSAALFLETYGNTDIRALTIGSGIFLRNPPGGFAEYPLLTPREHLVIGREDQAESLHAFFENVRGLSPEVQWIERAEILNQFPFFSPDYVAHAVLEANASEIDVDVLLQSFLKGMRQQGGLLVTDAEAEKIEFTKKNGKSKLSKPVIVRRF